MARLTARERRESYLREYAYQKKTGKPFFAALFHDVVVNLFFVLLIIGLAVLWKETSLLGPLYEAKADLAVPAYDPKPEWYYFFLFQLLKVFNQPNLLLIGTIVVPTIWMGLLLTMPFIDRTRERRISRRPIAVGFAAAMAVLLLTLTYKGSADAGIGGAGTAEWAATPGSAFVSKQSCSTCHVLSAAGWVGNVGPSLNTPHTYDLVLDRVSNGKGNMPNFKAQGLTDQQLQCISAVISTVDKGTAGPKAPKEACAGGLVARVPDAEGRMRYFVGITGASGAPYAARVLQGLAAAGAEVGVCASPTAGEVIAYEVYRDRSLDPALAIRRFVSEFGGEGATLYAHDDWFSPYASGSAKCDGYLICPCSMATAGTIASSGQANLIHRAAGVALKEGRRLVLVPRETPLSVIHLEVLLKLRQAGALMLPAMPAFYTLPDTLDDAIAFVAGKALDLLGVEGHEMLKRWGQ